MTLRRAVLRLSIRNPLLHWNSVGRLDNCGCRVAGGAELKQAMVFDKLRQAIWNGRSLNSPPVRRKEYKATRTDKSAAMPTPTATKKSADDVDDDADLMDGNVSSKVCLFESISKGNIGRCLNFSRPDPHRRPAILVSAPSPAPVVAPVAPVASVATAPRRIVEGRAAEKRSSSPLAVPRSPGGGLEPGVETLTIQRLPGEELGLLLDVSSDGRWRVVDIEPNSAVGREGTLQPGHSVLSVNGAELAVQRREDVLALLHELPLRVVLAVARPALQRSAASSGGDSPGSSDGRDRRSTVAWGKQNSSSTWRASARAAENNSGGDRLSMAEEFNRSSSWRISTGAENNKKNRGGDRQSAEGDGHNNITSSQRRTKTAVGQTNSSSGANNAEANNQESSAVVARSRKYHKRAQTNDAAGLGQQVVASDGAGGSGGGGVANVNGRLHASERWKSDSCESLLSGLTAESRCASTTSIDTLLMGDRDYLSKALGFTEVTVDLFKTKGEYLGVSVMTGKEAMADYFQIKRIHEGGAIGRSRMFQPGDYLCALNDTSLMGIAKHELVRVMQNAEGHIQMTVLRRDDGGPSRGVSPFPSRPGTPNSCDVDQLFSGLEVFERAAAPGNSTNGPHNSDNAALFAQSRVKLRMSSTSGPFGLSNASSTNLDAVIGASEEDEEDEDRAVAESGTQTSPSRSTTAPPAAAILRMDDRHLLASESHTDGSLRGPRPSAGLLTTEYELQNRSRGPRPPSPARHRPSFLAKVVRRPSQPRSARSGPSSADDAADRERRHSLSQQLNAEMAAAEEWLQRCLDDVRSASRAGVEAPAPKEGPGRREGSLRSSRTVAGGGHKAAPAEGGGMPKLRPAIVPSARGRKVQEEAKAVFGPPFEIQVCKGILGLGLKVKVVQGRAIVQEVQKRGPVAKLGRVRPGDCLLSVNDQTVVGVSESRVNNVLRVAPRGLVTLVLCRPGGTAGDPDTSSRPAPEGTDAADASTLRRRRPTIEDRRSPCIRVESFVRSLARPGAGAMNDGGETTEPVVSVTLEKNTILGFCIEGGLRAPGGDRPVRIKRFFKGPMGDQASRVLRCGDEILSVNGLSFANLSHEEAWSLLRRLPSGRVELCVRRGTEQNTAL